MMFAVGLFLTGATQVAGTAGRFLGSSGRDHALSIGPVPLTKAFARVFLTSHASHEEAEEQSVEEKGLTSEDDAVEEIAVRAPEEDAQEGAAEESSAETAEEDTAETAEESEADGAEQRAEETVQDNAEESAEDKAEEEGEEEEDDDGFMAECLDFSRAVVIQSEGSKKAVADRMHLVCSGFQLPLDVEVCQKYRSTLLAHLAHDNEFNLKKLDYPLFCQGMEKVANEHEAEVNAMNKNMPPGVSM